MMLDPVPLSMQSWRLPPWGLRFYMRNSPPNCAYHELQKSMYSLLKAEGPNYSLLGRGPWQCRCSNLRLQQLDVGNVTEA